MEVEKRQLKGRMMKTLQNSPRTRQKVMGLKKRKKEKRRKRKARRRLKRRMRRWSSKIKSKLTARVMEDRI